MHRIGVISDTHIPKRAKQLPAAVLEAFRETDLIIHAGDISDWQVLTDLKQLAPIIAVAGNVDPPELALTVGKRRCFSVGCFRFGVVHGDGKGLTTPGRALRAFKDEGVDCTIFGHSHTPYMAEVNGILLFNPGSPTDKRREPQYSYGILEVREAISGKIIRFS